MISCTEFSNLFNQLLQNNLGNGICCLYENNSLPFSVYLDKSDIFNLSFKLPEKHSSFILLLDDLDSEQNKLICNELKSKGHAFETVLRDSKEYTLLEEKCSRVFGSIENARLRDVSFNYWFLWRPSEFLLQHWDLVYSQLPPTASILDLGCGSGRDLIFISFHDYLNNTKNFSLHALDHLSDSFHKLEILSRDFPFPTTITKHITRLLHDGSSVRNNSNGKVYSIDTILPQKSFDVIIVVRFLPRFIHDVIKNSIKSTGFIVYCQFSEDGNENIWDYGLDSIPKKFNKPKGINNILQLGELEKTFGSLEEFLIYANEIRYLLDGRPIQCFISRKL